MPTSCGLAGRPLAPRHRGWRGPLAGALPLAELAARRVLMGTPLFNLQFLNDPEGMGGNIFSREWFRYVDAVPAGARRVGVDLNASSS